MHAQKCPVCEGKGRLPVARTQGDNPQFDACQGCNGKGWVSVMDSPAEIVSPFERFDIPLTTGVNDIKITLTSSDMNNYMG